MAGHAGVDTDPLSDARIVESWRSNVGPWTAAVRTGQIASRRLCTNQAIVEAILARSPSSVLDVGCGEGWLARALECQGIRVTGVDVVPGLIENARSAGAGVYRVMSYEELAAGQLAITVDVIACNFSLLGRESVERLFAACPALLKQGGSVIVQTLHPVFACGDHPYASGWREGSWAGFGPDFTDPAPWYFRTLEDWVELFSRNQLALVEVREPLHPGSGAPASIIFVAVKVGIRPATA